MKKKKDLLQKSAEAPAEFLDRSIVTTQKLTAQLPTNDLLRKTEDYWHMLGPGLTTGASDDDPSGIATYSQTGAQFGFHFLWLAAWTFPLSAIVQEMCARIGLVTGRGLAGNIRVHFSRRVLYVCAMLLFIANAVNIGADLGAMAKGAQLLNPNLSFGWLVVGFTALSLGLQIFTPYVRYARYLKWLAMVLLAYVFSALLAHLNWGEIIQHAFIPNLSFHKDELLILCAILGTTISPYLFFWQTSQEVEEQILNGKTTLAERRTATDPRDVKSMRIDVAASCIPMASRRLHPRPRQLKRFGRSPAMPHTSYSRSASSAQVCSPFQCSPGPPVILSARASGGKRDCIVT
jgi:Mn2+/Fe2+ NRAMP family transporter